MCRVLIQRQIPKERNFTIREFVESGETTILTTDDIFPVMRKTHGKTRITLSGPKQRSQRLRRLQKDFLSRKTYFFPLIAFPSCYGKPPDLYLQILVERCRYVICSGKLKLTKMFYSKVNNKI